MDVGHAVSKFGSELMHKRSRLRFLVGAVLEAVQRLLGKKRTRYRSKNHSD